MFFITKSILQRLLFYLSTLNIREEELLEKIGENKTFLKHTRDKFPLEDYYRIMGAAVALSGDSHFGLHMGEKCRLGDLSILGYIMANCHTLGEALSKASKYFGIIGSVLDIYLKTEGDYSKIVYDMRKHYPDRYTKHCIDTGLVNVYNLLKTILRTPVTIKEVWIKSDATEDVSEYNRIFHCPVHFGQPLTALILPTKDLLIPTIHPNPSLLSLLEHHAKCILSEIKESSLLSKKISLLLLNQMKGSNPSLGNIAKELGLSTRVIQRRLREEKITFSQVVAKVRKELAKRYLLETNYSIEDITYLLGFSEPSVFRRAFKTWTGSPPGKYRTSSRGIHNNKTNTLYGSDMHMNQFHWGL